MDYHEYIQKDRYSLRIDFEGKLGNKNKEFLFEMLSDLAFELANKLESDVTYGETKPIILDREIVESI